MKSLLALPLVLALSTAAQAGEPIVAPTIPAYYVFDTPAPVTPTASDWTPMLVAGGLIFLCAILCKGKDRDSDEQVGPEPSPIPLPGTGGALLAGVATLAYWRRRQLQWSSEV